jgi:hypothetical protein
MHGLFLVRERQRACSSWHGAGAALLLMVALLPGCSDVALPSEEMPASGAYPWYNDLVANHLKKTFTNRASYDAFAISAFRWVHSLNGWAWMTCVRFEDRVLRLITRSNLVGCSTGISAGFSPCRILSTNSAARRYRSGKFAPYDVKPPASTSSRRPYTVGNRALSASAPITSLLLWKSGAVVT